MKIPITTPSIGEEEITAVAECLRSGWLVQGPRVAAFEAAWTEYTGVKYAIACTSCTTALHLALLAAGIGPGDEVIVPSFTWVASANAVEYCGATPVFADIDLETFNIDFDSIEPLVNERTRAVLAVHQFGLSADIRGLQDLCLKNDIKLLEDAACACGSLYENTHVGGFGFAGCFSFHPRKAITTGEGGMITTNDPEIARTLSVMRAHGAEVSDLERHRSKNSFELPSFKALGFNYRMTDIQAAIGLEQLKKAPEILGMRRERAVRYHDSLSSCDGLRIPVQPEGYRHAYQSYVLFVERGKEERDRIAIKLSQNGISVRQGTHAVHTLDYYRNKYQLPSNNCPNAVIAQERSLTIPLYASMSDEEQDFIVSAIRKLL